MKFQFPSNGKARVNSLVRASKVGTSVVSIPFKREGTCERGGPKAHGSIIGLFQFPSNGKARVNRTKEINAPKIAEFVSIPFKREGTCELI